MTMISAISRAPKDAYAQLVRELQDEFECGDVGAIAERIVEAEAADFHWETRVRECYLGQHIGSDLESGDLEQELSRLALLSLLGGAWHPGVCLVDGDGASIEMVWVRRFDAFGEAEYAYLRAH